MYVFAYISTSYLWSTKYRYLLTEEPAQLITHFPTLTQHHAEAPKRAADASSVTKAVRSTLLLDLVLLFFRDSGGTEPRTVDGRSREGMNFRLNRAV